MNRSVDNQQAFADGLSGRDRKRPAYGWSAAATSVLMVAATAISVLPRADAQESGVINREYEIKAAYLYNFAKYVEWPADFVPVSENKEPVFVIGIVGSNPFGNALELIAAEKRVADKRIVVVPIRRAEETKSCHIIYFTARSDPKLVADLLEATKSSPTLTVGEQETFVKSGGILNFYVLENKVKFEIDAQGAEAAHLKISSKLLNIARNTQANR